MIAEYKCSCESPVAYICINELPNVKDAVSGANIKGMKDKESVLFLLNDSVVMDSKHSLVLAELASLSFDK